MVRLVRLFAMGATISYLVVGVASAPAPFDPVVFAAALLLGVFFHIYADVANDVADLPLDTGDPRRAHGPLVRGDIQPATAAFIALFQLPLMYGVIAVVHGSAQPVAALSMAVVLIALYNIAGKSVPVPAVADVIQGLGWAALVLLGAALAGGIGTSTYLAMGYVTVYIAMVNGIHGALRDLRNDRAHGMKTTSLLLGADVANGSVTLPRRLVVYAASLQMLLWVLLLSAIGVGRFGGLGALIAVSLLGAASATAVLGYRRRRDLRRAMALGTWHLVLVPAAFLAAYLSSLPFGAATIGVAAYLVPPLAYDRALRGLEFDLPSTIVTEPIRDSPLSAQARVLWGMTRPGTWLAAGALAVIGAMLGGVIWRDAIAAAITSALIVAAANVFNDRCDVGADRLNRPDRPLVSGRLRGVTADRFVLFAGALATAVAATLGALAATAAGVAFVVALAYSLLLRRWLVTGTMTVALLFGSPLVYGGAFASGGVSSLTWFAAALVFIFVLAREFLMGVPDVDGDLRSGYQTVAAVFGKQTAYWAFRAGLVAFLAALWTPVLFGAGAGYALSVAFCAVIPTVMALARLGRAPTAASVGSALTTTGVVFGTGLVPLLFLV